MFFFYKISFRDLRCAAIVLFILAMVSLQFIKTNYHKEPEERFHQPRYARLQQPYDNNQVKQVQMRSIANLNMLGTKDFEKNDDVIIKNYAEFDKNNVLFQIKK